MITALSWIPRGKTLRKLLPSSANDAEVERYYQILQNQEAQPQQVQSAEADSPEDAEIIKKYNLDKYDDDEDDDEAELAAREEMGIVAEDQYRREIAPGTEEEENEDDLIKTTDFLLMVGKYGEDVPTLEVHIFDDTQESLFIHHEILLPSFPLSIKWLDYEPGTGHEGSFAAISSMRPEIEIWNLNIEEPVCPAAVLQFHTNSVPGLSWNMHQRGVLLSASIDQKAAVWSLQTSQVAAAFDVNGECKAAEWCLSPSSPSLFTVASTTGVYSYDARSGPAFATLPEMSIESLVWSRDGNEIWVSLTTGQVAAVDIRNPTAGLTIFQAHTGPVNSLAYCMAKPVLATCGDDEFCKLWNIENPAEPKQIDEDNPKVGPMFTCMFSPDKPTLLAIGGHENGASLWDIANVI